MNGSQQILYLFNQNLQLTKSFRLGKKKKKQAAATEEPED